MKNLLLFLTLMGVFVMVHAQQPLSPSPPSAPISHAASVAQFPEASANASARLTYQIIDAPNHTFGYGVLADGKMIFQQMTLGQHIGAPAAKPPMPQDMQGFKTREEATSVAQLAMDKIRRGEMPPVITTEELQRLNVVK